MRKPSLLTQIVAVNAILLCAAIPAALAISKLDVGSDNTDRMLAIIAAILATVLVNGIVVRRRLWPIERLIDFVEKVDLQQSGQRVDIPEADSTEAIRLNDAFNRMLARLEDERTATSMAVLRGQEQERARLARDLHDEANQSLTGLLLRLEAAAQKAPPEIKAELAETRALASEAMDELLRLARELRPSALDDLGLSAALESQANRFARQTGTPVRLTTNGPLRDLGDNEQIVIYRMVQESLSNIARHAEAEHVTVEIGPDCSVRVTDDGRGFDSETVRGDGLVGMCERARLAGASVAVKSRRGSGTVVELTLRDVA